MSEREDVVNFLEDLKDQFHPEDDEYADISQTIYYVQRYC